MLDMNSSHSKNGQKTPDKLTNCPDSLWNGIVSKLQEFALIEYEILKHQCNAKKRDHLHKGINGRTGG